MSSKHERLSDDFYVTPAWAVHRLLDRLPVPWGGVWVEPSAGNGAIIKAVREYFVDGAQIPWLAIEKRSEETGYDLTNTVALCQDFLGERTLENPNVSFVLGNPPYSQAFEFVKQAHRLYPNAKIAFLLRLGFLASASRNSWMQEHTPDVYVLPNRPSFAHGKTDSQEYAWFVWNPPPREAHGRLEVLDLTPTEVRSGKATEKLPGHTRGLVAGILSRISSGRQLEIQGR